MSALFVSAFIVLLFIEIILFVFIRKRLRKSEARKGCLLLTLFLFILLWIITLKFVVFPPVRDIPVTGSYSIESLDYWVDEGRTDPYLGEGTNREPQVRKWCPLDSKDELPVIFASHGSCGTIDNNVSLYRELASHGYTVLAVCHPGQAASMQYKDGYIYSDSAYPHLREWAQYKNNAMFLDENDLNYTNIYYKGIRHMGLCDLSVASPILSVLLNGGFQNVDAYTQLEKLNADCIEWLNIL